MKDLTEAKINIGIGWFVLIFCISLLDLPFRYFLKDQLCLSATEIAFFFAIANIPIYSKPILGIFTDSISLWGSRRRFYVIICLVVCSILYFLLGFMATVSSSLGCYLMLCVFLAILSVVLGAIMVEYGQKYQNTGGMSSLRLAMSKTAVLIGGPVGGYLAYRNFNISTSVCMAMMLLLMFVYIFTLKEIEVTKGSSDIWADIKKQFHILSHSKVLLFTGVLVLLWKLSPGFQTPLWFHQTSSLHFSSSFIGILYSVMAATGIIGAIIYGKMCKWINLRRLLYIGVIIDALDSLVFLFYEDEMSAIIISTLTGISSILCVLPLYDLAARATPKRSESLGYALIFSVWNFADAISDMLGSSLYDNYNLGFNELVWINTFTTAAILFLIPILPKWITKYTDL